MFSYYTSVTVLATILEKYWGFFFGEMGNHRLKVKERDPDGLMIR